MLQQESPQIGDRISAQHSAGNVNCENVDCLTVDGYVRSIGNTAIMVDTGDTITKIRLGNGWDVTIHPEIKREDS